MNGMQTSLFTSEVTRAPEPERLIVQDGDVRLYRQWFPPDEARDWFDRLHREIRWRQSSIRMHGKTLPVPRLDAWYGDPGRAYTYSGLRFEPLAWTPGLRSLRLELEAQLGYQFNSVLANLYRDGRDSVAWHSDDEPELGSEPVIASISLGAERRFALKHKYRRQPSLRLDLPPGSLLLMAGATQRYWVHQLAKTTRPVGPRINLTFRRIMTV